ncbi:hypothetical protein SPBR_04923 [Sporothrix brasiliensis 5110]|uniref:DUF7924 domain-containing protein n=1 Tax=Sporothrix brasiliensis 5110 TaxID=1398154 RepID=A0A0C2IPY7_9PEZI|nr:uncharacterized protein SPBR_04923 [Sporothrix brasiliensis 5110]KIH87117.1 hypothetical protein SPBR_04923 [Sporothrix brasiliensis 5110]
MNGHTQNPRGQHSAGDRDSYERLHNDTFTQTQTAAGIKTSSPTKRAFAPCLDHDTSAPKRARLPSQVDKDDAIFIPPTDLLETPLHHPRPNRLPSPLAHPLDPLDAFVSQWLQTVGSSERQRNCRSASSRSPLRDEEQTKLVEEKATAYDKVKDTPKRPRSAPPDLSRKDADGYTIPQIPESWAHSTDRSRKGPGSVYTGDSSLPSGPRIRVDDADYRDVLEHNNIHFRDDWEPLPDHVETLVARMRKKRDSPGPTEDEVLRDRDRQTLVRGTGEPRVAAYYTRTMFPVAGAADVLQASARMPMNRRVVPFAADGPRGTDALGLRAPRYCTPTPDLLYGYNSANAFPDEDHRTHLFYTDHEVRATNEPDTLVYPFLVVEFKGVDGNMLVADNQCLGGTATCISLAETLNRQLRAFSRDAQVIHAVESSAFSIAMNGADARLYVSWTHGDRVYYTQTVQVFHMGRPDHYLDFRRMVRNIIDWGRNDRLRAVRQSLDAILEETRKRYASESKAWQRSPDSAGSPSGRVTGRVTGKDQRQET